MDQKNEEDEQKKEEDKLKKEQAELKKKEVNREEDTRRVDRLEEELTLTLEHELVSSRSSRDYIKALYNVLTKGDPREAGKDRDQAGLFIDDDFHVGDVQALLERVAETYVAAEIPIDLRMALPTLMGGFEDIVSDSFNKCFEAHIPEPWNWNVYLFPAWLIGCVIRYVLLVPIRILICIGSVLCFLLGSFFVRHIVKDDKRVLQIESRLMWYLANAWIMACGGVIRYEGKYPSRGPNQIFVANHSSLIDYVVLLGAQTFAVVGQKHPRMIGFFQHVVLKCLNCIWFDRKDLRDRNTVRRKIQEHVDQADIAPLLIFPEGTCVNNQYTVMFKRGAFELDVDVHPIAIKYNNIFVDAFWDSRSVSFLRYMLTLFSSWALICDVNFLPRQRRREDETTEQFAQRVQKLVSDAAGLEMTNFDGYFKHIRPSDKFLKQRQVETARAIQSTLNLHKKLQEKATRAGTAGRSDALRRRTSLATIAYSPDATGTKM